MKRKLFLALISLSVPALLSAVPANPRVRTLTNPDGTEVQVRVHGDEFFHFMTDADCTKIIERDSKGFISDAIRDGKPLKFSKQEIMLLRDEAMAATPFFTATDRSSMQKMASLNSEGRTTYPTIGEGNRSLVVLVEFHDVAFTIENPKNYYTRQLNEPGFSDYGAYGSALDYYRDASHGLYLPKFDVVGPVKISKNASYFKNNSSGNMAVLIREALTSLHDSGEVDFSNYDLDENGIVDTVFFYYAGYGQADSDTETIWPHQYDFQMFVNYSGESMLAFDGKKIGPYACANELSGYNPVTNKSPWKDGSEPWMDGIGTFVHEYGHVLGLPDLYDVEQAQDVWVTTPGEWDVMDTGSYNFNGCRPPLFSAYEQWLCNWLEYTDAADGSHYDLTALGHAETPGAVRIRIPASSDGTEFQPEYFVVEARDNSSWDSCFPNPGLMVWRIKYNKNNWINNTVNSRNGSNVEIVYAKNSSKPLFNGGAIYPGGDKELTPSKEYPFWESPVISGIKYDAESKTGSFDFNAEVSGDACTFLHETPYAAADGSKSFELSWDAVPGVDSYRVTVLTANTKRVVDNFDNKDVGNVTSVVVSGLSNAYWKLEMEAYVTCVVNGIPSTSTSNVIRFKPSELPLAGEGAVDAIEGQECSIYGGQGCIHAPENAIVYDLNGMKLNKDKLSPGIYLVKYGPKTVKVMVR